MTFKNEHICKNCFFADTFGADLVCLRFPPQSMTITLNHYVGSRWGNPIISAPSVHWCGEWKPKEEPRQ